MYSLTIVFGQNHSVVWTLMFRDEEKAKDAERSAFARYKSALGGISENNLPLIDITDDFGQHVILHQKDIIAVMLEDMSKSKLAHIERALNHAHMQADMQRTVESDPKLRISRNMQGPSMISPIGPNGRM